MHVKKIDTILLIATIVIIISFIYLINLKSEKKDEVPRSATFVLNIREIKDKYE